MNQLGEDPAANADSKELAKVWSCTIWLRKAVGAAVSSTARTGLVGRAAASLEATGPSARITAGSVGTLIPAREALEDFSTQLFRSRMIGVLQLQNFTIILSFPQVLRSGH